MQQLVPRIGSVNNEQSWSAAAKTANGKPARDTPIGFRTSNRTHHDAWVSGQGTPCEVLLCMRCWLLQNWQHKMPNQRLTLIELTEDSSTVTLTTLQVILLQGSGSVRQFFVKCILHVEKLSLSWLSWAHTREGQNHKQQDNSQRID